MANRYWVGGSGTWDSESITHWSATSGGSGGASAPIDSDAVFFNAASGGGTVTLNSNQKALTLNTTGFAGVISGAYWIEVWGDVTIGTGTVCSFSQLVTRASCVLHSAGVTLPALMVGAGTTTLDGALTLSGALIGVSGSTFNAAGYAVTAASVDFGGGGATMTMGSGAWTVTGSSGTVWTVAGATVNAGTASIVLSGNGSRTFNSAGKSLGSVTVNGSTAGQIIDFTGGGTFNSLNSAIATAHTFRFSPGQTVTVKGMSNVASAGNLQTLTATSSFTLNYAGSDRVALDYLSLANCAASPANNFYAGTHSSDGGGNSGWVFSDPPPRASLFFGASF